MKTLHHPTLPVEQVVEDSAVDAWVEAGWRKTKPRTPAAATAADKASDNSERHDK